MLSREEICFNPSSNGNGAGIEVWVIYADKIEKSFNPSSNGNGAGIRRRR